MVILDLLFPLYIGYALFVSLKGYNSIETYRKEKKKKKAEKQRLKKLWGIDYYYRDVTWKKIKDQKPKENYYAWEKRLRIYDFSTDSVDLLIGQKHGGIPLVHSAKTNIDNFVINEKNNKFE